MTWGAVATVAAGGMGLAGSLMGNKGGDQQNGYDVVTAPQYSFTEPNMRLTSDYLNDAMQRLGRGEYPAYYDKALPQLREGMNRNLKNTYFGTGTDKGLYGRAFETGALTGTGPKATYAQAHKVWQDYADKSKQIDEYLTGMGVDIMNQQSTSIPQMMMQMPQGPNSEVVRYNSGAQEGTGSMMSNLGSIFGMVSPQDMGGSISSLLSLFKKKQTPTQDPAMMDFLNSMKLTGNSGQ